MRVVQLVKRSLDIRIHPQIPLSGILHDGRISGADPLRFARTQKLCDAFWNVLLGDNSGAAGILNIVIDVGDAIGKADDASLCGKRFRPARMAQDTVAHLFCKIQAAAVVLQLLHHATRRS